MVLYLWTVVIRVCKSGYPDLSVNFMAAKNPDILVANPDIRYPDISVNFMVAKNPDILMIDSGLLCNKSMYVYILYSFWCCWFSLILEF